MRSLSIVQKIFSIVKIVASVLMVLCFISAGLCLITAFTIGSISQPDIDTIIGTMPIYSEVFDSYTASQLSAITFIAFVVTLTHGILALFTRRFAAAELAEGNPFTETTVSNMRTLAIIVIVLPFIADIVISFIYNRSGLTDMDISNGSTMMFGVLLLIMSFVLQAGTEMIGEAKKDDSSDDKQ